MTSSPSNRDASLAPPPQSKPASDNGEQLCEDAAPTPSKNVEMDQLLQTDFEIWLRHFGAC
jgi:hypothetical protein